jgi:hypothetical protein
METQIEIHINLDVLPAILNTFYHLILKISEQWSCYISQPPPAVIKSVALSEEVASTSEDESFDDNMLLAENKLRKAASFNSLKAKFQNQMQLELVELSSNMQSLREIIACLRGKVNTLTTSLNKYRKKAEHQHKLQSVPLNEAIVNAVNQLVSSQQCYKLLSKQNLATIIAKAVFDPNLCHGVTLEEVVAESKKWIQQNVFKPSEILKKMGLRGGTVKESVS